MTFQSIAKHPESDAFIYFCRFLECLCLSDGCGYSSVEDVEDAAIWHAKALGEQVKLCDRYMGSNR